jgi:hypothetical protein
MAYARARMICCCDDEVCVNDMKAKIFKRNIRGVSIVVKRRARNKEHLD